MDWGNSGGHTDSAGEGRLVRPLEKFADQTMRRTWRRLSGGKLFVRLTADVPGDLEALFDELDAMAEA